MRSRSPGNARSGGKTGLAPSDEEGDPLLAAAGLGGGSLTVGSAREGVSTAEAMIGGGGEAGKAGQGGGRELTFWGFAKQLGTHANFWL